MAGAGYKTFVAGQVLTATQVQTYLQDQVTMVFDDSTARDATLGTFVAEGMMTYLKDSNSVEYYDSSAWQPITDQAIREDFLTSAGALITSSASAVPSLITLGTAGQVLTVVGNAPAWADAGSGGGGGFNTLTKITATNSTYSIPAATSNIFKFTLIGGGGGGWYNNNMTSGGSGGSTTLNVGGTVVGTAVGGSGGGQASASPPPGGASAQVWAADNGGGAQFGSGNDYPGAAGRGGEVVVLYQDLEGFSTIGVTIGAAGNAGSSSYKGGTGLILMEYSA